MLNEKLFTNQYKTCDMLRKLHLMLLIAIATGSFAQTSDYSLSAFSLKSFKPEYGTSSNNNLFIQSGNINKEVFSFNVQKPAAAFRFNEHNTTSLKIALMWDVSASSSGKNTEREIAILQSYLKEFSHVQVTVVLFSSLLHRVKHFSISNGKADSLFAYLKRKSYDEGVQLGVLDLKEFEVDEFILSSNGYKAAALNEIEFINKPITILQSSLTANTTYLKSISENSGGKYLNLNAMSDAETLAEMTNQRQQIAESELSANNDDYATKLENQFKIVYSKMNYLPVSKKRNFKLWEISAQK